MDSTTEENTFPEAEFEQTESEFSQEQNSNTASEKGKTNSSVNFEQEYNKTNDQYVRLYAEFENFRKRTARESFELIANANSKLLGKLTDVLDNFYLAFDPKHKTDKLEDFEKGIRLIFNKFKDVLEDEGLEAIDPVGAEFDPNLHEALMQQPSDTVEENKIISVFQKGYKVKSKIVKHAKVIVSTGKAE